MDAFAGDKFERQKARGGLFVGERKFVRELISRRNFALPSVISDQLYAISYMQSVITNKLLAKSNQRQLIAVACRGLQCFRFNVFDQPRCKPTHLAAISVAQHEVAFFSFLLMKSFWLTSVESKSASTIIAFV